MGRRRSENLQRQKTFLIEFSKCYNFWHLFGARASEQPWMKRPGNGSRDKIDTKKEKDLNHSVIKFISETCSLCVRTFSILLSMDYRIERRRKNCRLGRKMLRQRENSKARTSRHRFSGRAMIALFQFSANRNLLNFKLESRSLSRIQAPSLPSKAWQSLFGHAQCRHGDGPKRSAWKRGR